MFGAEEISAYDFSELNGAVSEVSFEEIVGALLRGDVSDGIDLVGKAIWNSLFAELEQGRKQLATLLALAVAGGVLIRFLELFAKGSVSKTALYVLDLAFIGVLFAGFQTAGMISQTALEQIVHFMKALIPIYGLAVAAAGKVTTAAVAGQLLFFGATIVEWIVIGILLPAIRVFLLLLFLDQLAGGDVFGKMRDLLEKGISCALKGATGALLGLHLVQGLVLPALDSGKTQVGTRLISLIPGIGAGAQAVIGTVLGSAILIKNGIGAAGMLVLVFLMAVPCCKLLLLAGGYQLVAALIQPAADAAMAEMAAGCGKALGLLVKAVLFGGLLFFVSLAVLTACTGTNVTG